MNGGGGMKTVRILGVAVATALAAVAGMPAGATTLIVVDARGGGLKPGQKIDSGKPIVLKDGERVTLIGPDGKAITLHGKFSGPPLAHAGPAADPKSALAALISTRSARTNSVGVVRGGTDAAPLPEPWLIDVSRSGERCLKAGQKPIWWRPTKTAATPFTVFPIDRSWRADFQWKTGQDRMDMPSLGKIEGQTMFVVHADDQDHVVSVNVIPAEIDSDVVLASWMLEKGCTQQADALLRQLQTAQATLPTQAHP